MNGSDAGTSAPFTAPGALTTTQTPSKPAAKAIKKVSKARAKSLKKRSILRGR